MDEVCVCVCVIGDCYCAVLFLKFQYNWENFHISYNLEDI